MTKIVFIGGNLCMNKGGAAIVVSARDAIKKLIPDAEFTLSSFLYSSDFQMGEKYNIRIVSELSKSKLPFGDIMLWSFRLFRVAVWGTIHRRFGLNILKLTDERMLKEYTNCNVVIEISGDGLSGDYGIFSTFISFSKIMICVLLEKPVVIYAQSIGPYNLKWPVLNKESRILSKISRFFAGYVLNKVDLITVREEITLDILKKLGIAKPPIYLTADSAFLLAPASGEIIQKLLSKYEINPDEKIVGLSVSKNISMLQYDSKSKRSDSYYKEVLIQIIDYIRGKFGVKIILIPHATGPGDAADDRVAIREILLDIKDKNGIIGVTEDLTPEELKGIIGRCELLVGSRMHANIAALSMAIPTIAVGYSHKTKGIMKMMGQEEFICDFQELDISSIIKKIEKAWRNKERIAEELEIRGKIVKEQAFFNAVLVKQLLEA
jgi:colanic acid/amylovoran biosynthesis protein